MANTYTQLHIHFVFAVKYRQALITPEWEERLYKYITGIVQNNGHKMLAVNAAYDHIHLFVGLNPKQSISELMRLVKGDSSEFVNKERFTQRKFYWQEGYGAFSHSHSQIDTVIKYIFNQKEHHARKNFKDEYRKMLDDYGINYNDQYLFADPED
ncbi:IS200/IS605 family transposase [Niabella sp.]|uniref:IS200/IS605 family transposase n=1 Tax=Niabella sp. TaxID=1962976 RepID=UPI0026306EE4|nr:IS200/IS605 family transposase [Niabella sp.]